MNSSLDPIFEPDPESWVKIGCVAEIPVSGARRVRTNSVDIAVFRTTDDVIYALQDQCPHKGGPLSEGIVHGDCVTCPLHNWVISLADGEAQGADEGGVKSYPVRVDNEQVFIRADCDL